MKNLLLLMICCTGIVAEAQIPILSFATEKHEPVWYAEQAALWHKRIEANEKDALAWYNYYYATRNWVRTNIKNDKRSHEQKMRAYNQIMDSMRKSIPNTFECNLLEYMQSWNDPEKESFLLKAHAMDPDRMELIHFMLNYGEIHRKLPIRDQYAKMWLNSDISSNGLLHYAYNMLQSADSNAIIFTEGDNDTYPIWQIQSTGVRRDVVIINTSLIQIDHYRNALFKELNIPPVSDTMNTKKGATLVHAQQIIQHIFKHLQGRKLYASVSMMPISLDSVKNQLYLTGLLYEISKTPVNSHAVIRSNLENRYALDYLETNFKHDISQHYVNCLNANYVVPMLTLYKEYLITGEKEKANKLKIKIEELAPYCEDKNEVLEQLKP
jgi:hypothetical protein